MNHRPSVMVKKKTELEILHATPNGNITMKLQLGFTCVTSNKGNDAPRLTMGLHSDEVIYLKVKIS